MRRALAASVLLLAGCSSFGRPTREVLDAVARLPRPPGPYVRVQGRVEARIGDAVESVGAVLVARTAGEPAVRLQFRPEIGPKTLDLLARPTRVVGYLPLLNQGSDGPPAPAHPLGMMAVSLLEYYSTVDAERVLGARAEDGGWWLRLRPVVAGVDVTAWLSPRGRIERKRFEWNGARLDQVEEPDGTRFTSDNAEMRVMIQQERSVPSLDASLFELTLPPDTKPIEIPR